MDEDLERKGYDVSGWDIYGKTGAAETLLSLHINHRKIQIQKYKYASVRNTKYASVRNTNMHF